MRWIVLRAAYELHTVVESKSVQDSRLDIEDNLDGLRYDKVILATDADVDGLHIRNLLITYFYKFFEQLVHDGHLFVLETPLFRVRNKEKSIYCYSEAERDTAAKELGRNPEITRFKLHPDGERNPVGTPLAFRVVRVFRGLDLPDSGSWDWLLLGLLVNRSWLRRQHGRTGL
jgi:hypothetical protein